MNNMPSVDDVSLVRLACKGNGVALNQLLKRYHYKTKKIVFFYFNNETHADDLTQEVLLKVFLNLHCFKEDSQFSTWVYRITQNTIKNYLRLHQLRAISEEEYINDQAIAEDYTPEQQLIYNELGEQIIKALARLSDDLKLCYGKYALEGKSYECIANEMHCPIGTVRSRIFRARQLLIDFVSNSHPAARSM